MEKNEWLKICLGFFVSSIQVALELRVWIQADSSPHSTLCQLLLRDNKDWLQINLPTNVTIAFYQCHEPSKLVHDSLKPTWYATHKPQFHDSGLHSNFMIPLATSWIFQTNFKPIFSHFAVLRNLNFSPPLYAFFAFSLFIGFSLFCDYLKSSSLDIGFSLIYHYSTS
jgi:hypothetical protein